MNDEQAFQSWMRAVDGYVDGVAGCSVYDLPDCTFRDWFDSGMGAEQAARECIAAARADSEYSDLFHPAR